MRHVIFHLALYRGNMYGAESAKPFLLQAVVVGGTRTVTFISQTFCKGLFEAGAMLFSYKTRPRTFSSERMDCASPQPI